MQNLRPNILQLPTDVQPRHGGDLLERRLGRLSRDRHQRSTAGHFRVRRRLNRISNLGLLHRLPKRFVSLCELNFHRL
jgi:hypothetical protein